MDLETIKERIFKVRDHLDLAHALFPGFGRLKWSFKHAYAIYIDDGVVTPVFGYLTDSLEKGEGPGFFDDFKAYLKRYKPGTLRDTLFLLDAYSLSREVLGYPYPWDLAKFNPVKAVDAILSESKGILLWDHQLDQLFHWFFPDYDQDIDLRKAVNHKRAEIFDLAAMLKFDSDISLNDVLKDRMVFSLTCKPDHSGAIRLFSHFRKISGGSLAWGETQEASE